jgi:WD40 repeat protein
MPVYDAFISYSHARDKSIATALHSVIQRLGKPWYRRRALRVFRDDASLSATPGLWPTIQQSLGQSRFLILLASPEAAASPWVNKELAYWLEHKGVDTLLIALTDGELVWDAARGDFGAHAPLPVVVMGRFPAEPRWVDLTAYREGADKRDAKFIELAANFAAAICGLPKEDLLSQEVRQQRRALALAWSAAGTLLLLAVATTSATVQAYRARETAEENERVALKNEGISLTALSDAALKDHPVDAIQLALAAWPRKGDEKRPQMRRVITALAFAMSEYQEGVRFEVSNVVRHAAFSPDGKRVITASEDNKADIWDAETGKHLTSLIGHEGFVWSAAFASDGARVVTASEDGTARVWSAETGEKLLVINGNGAGLRRATFSLDAAHIVTASKDKKARIWDAKTGKQLVQLRGHTDEVWSAVFSPDGGRVVTASLDTTARIWDAKTGKQLVKPLKHDGEVYSAAFSRDGAHIVTASEDGTVGIWNAKTGQKDGHLTTDYKKNKFTSAAFSPDGRRIVTASHDFTVRMWDVSTKRVLIELKGHDDVVNSATFSADGTHILSASDDTTARIWDIAAAPFLTVAHGDDYVYKVSFSPDGARIVTASRDESARIWNASTGALLTTLPSRKGAFKGDLGAMNTAKFDPQGERLVTASDYAVVIWNAKTGKPLITLDRNKWFLSAAFSPDGSRIVTAAQDKTARIWDAKTGDQLIQPLEHPDKLTFADFRPDGERVVTASEDGIARVWDARTGKLLKAFNAHGGRMRGAAFSADGGRIVTASDDGTARVWNARTAEVIAVLKGHLKQMASAAFNPDGTRVITASEDGTARVWDAKTGQLLAVPNANVQGEGLSDAVFSPNGAQIAIASEDGTARIWNIEISDAFTLACDRLGNKADLTDLARRYDLDKLKPICGSNAPIKGDFSNMPE